MSNQYLLEEAGQVKLRIECSCCIAYIEFGGTDGETAEDMKGSLQTIAEAMAHFGWSFWEGQWCCWGCQGK